MNIVTFCSAVSIDPKLYIVSLYYDTLTKDSFLKAKVGMLQLLTPSHKHLVNVLGKHSGYDTLYRKETESKKLGFAWRPHDTYSVLPECATYVELAILDCIEAGDHQVALCRVTNTYEWDRSQDRLVSSLHSEGAAIDHDTALYTGMLRNEGIL